MLNKPFVKRQINKAYGMYYVYKGDKAYRQMKANKSIAFYNKGLELYPEHYGAWYNLGNLYVAYEDYYAALYAYSQAFKYNPNMMVARMNYGIISTEKLGDFDSALEQYNKIVETNRKTFHIPYIYNNKLSSKENKAIAYYNIGVAYRMKSLYEHDNWELQRTYLSKAIDAYKKSLKISPNSYDTLFNLGLAYQVTGNLNKAGKCYCKAIKVAPMNYEAHYNLAVLLRRLGKFQDSYEEIDKASTIVSALGDNSSLQYYMSVIMNDITRSYYQSAEHQKALQNLLKEEERKLKAHAKRSEKKIKTKENKTNGTIVNEEMANIAGLQVSPEEMDLAVIKNFGKCPSIKYFEEEYSDSDDY